MYKEFKLPDFNLRVLCLLIGLLGSTLFCFAQQQVVIKGIVKDKKGEPLSGAGIKIKGTTTGAAADAAGRYSIKAAPDGILIISYSGFETQEINIANRTTIDVSMLESQKTLNEVVVSALGIEKDAKAVTYSTQKISGDELKKVPETNFMNNLSGKIAGVEINRSASGVGGSVKVVIRGNKSAAGGNQPLYVVDGVPLANLSTEQVNSTYSGRDGGDGISNINPEDIESINVLKGPAGAALYGSQAANGVILITTKKGRSGISRIDFSSSLTADIAAYTPKLQNSFGPTTVTSEDSWGNPITEAQDNVSDFFRTGKTMVNNISFSSGSEKTTNYITYANTIANGILPNNKLLRHNFDVRQMASFLNGRLSLDAHLSFVIQQTDNSPALGLTSNPLAGLYLFPRGRDFTPYKDNWSVYNPERKLDVQNWPFNSSVLQVNPYWLINKFTNTDKRHRTMFNTSAKYEVMPGMHFQVRGNMDRTNFVGETKIYAGTIAGLASPNGDYILNNVTATQLYGDAILTYVKSLGKIKFNGTLGSSITDSRFSGESFVSRGLYVANKFTIQNIMQATGSFNTMPEMRQQLQAAFTSLSFSYNDWAYLDVTGRNDWSSNLSFTPNGSYFYPSVAGNIILSSLVKLPAAITFAKFRGSYAIVGNSVPVYVTNPLNGLNSGGVITFNTTAPFTDLKPEKTKALELGTELRFLKDKLKLDLSYYKTNTTNQFFSIFVPPGTGYSKRFVNGGDIQNSGVEAMLSFDTEFAKKVKWTTTVNFAANRNKVKKLADGIDEFMLTDDVNFYLSILKVGGSYGDIYGTTLQKNEDGKILIGAGGLPMQKVGAPEFLGNANPKYTIGWNNSFSYKKLSLSFLVDAKIGGKVMSLTQQTLDSYGVSKTSGDARLNGGADIDGIDAVTGEPVTKISARALYGVTSSYMFNATNARIREVSIGYNLFTSKIISSYVKNVRVSVVGRNLAYLYLKAPFDPDLAYSVGNGFSGIDVFGPPATRSFGMSLNVGF
jgi:TonB-linked SusC/RagA family outer membrane protein